jgi:hypothetical protein
MTESQLWTSLKRVTRSANCGAAPRRFAARIVGWLSELRQRTVTDVQQLAGDVASS